MLSAEFIILQMPQMSYKEINRVAIEKESDYNKDFWKEKSIKKQSTFERWISGISKFQVMAFLTRNKSRIIYVDDLYDQNKAIDQSDCPSLSLSKKELFNYYLNKLTDREKGYNTTKPWL